MNAALHAAELFEASHGTEEGLRIWDYLTYGPWPDVDAYAALICADNLPVLIPCSSRSARTRPDGPVGQASFLDINAQNGVTEIGHIWFGPELQRTRGATEALFLMIRHAMDDLGYRRGCNGAAMR